MAQSPAVEAAFERLVLELDRLDAALGRRAERDRSAGELEEEIARLGEDRASLAETLDREKARSTRLEDTNREVSRRLVSAMESIRSVLDVHGG